MSEKSQEQAAEEHCNSMWQPRGHPEQHTRYSGFLAGAKWGSASREEEIAGMREKVAFNEVAKLTLSLAESTLAKRDAEIASLRAALSACEEKLGVAKDALQDASDELAIAHYNLNNCYEQHCIPTTQEVFQCEEAAKAAAAAVTQLSTQASGEK